MNVTLSASNITVFVDHIDAINVWKPTSEVISEQRVFFEYRIVKILATPIKKYLKYFIDEAIGNTEEVIKKSMQAARWKLFIWDKNEMSH